MNRVAITIILCAVLTACGGGGSNATGSKHVENSQPSNDQLNNDQSQTDKEWVERYTALKPDGEIEIEYHCTSNHDDSCVMDMGGIEVSKFIDSIYSFESYDLTIREYFPMIESDSNSFAIRNWFYEYTDTTIESFSARYRTGSSWTIADISIESGMASVETYIYDGTYKQLVKCTGDITGDIPCDNGEMLAASLIDQYRNKEKLLGSNGAIELYNSVH